MIARCLLPLLALGFLAACASGPAVNPSLTAAVAQAGVSGPTLAKMQSARALDFSDILLLVEKQVPTHIVESYLQSTESVYQFSPAQMTELRNAGASSQLLSYLSHTGGFYAAPSSSSSSGMSGAAERQATNSPLNQDQQPFAYNAPVVDYWYNSGYEESLYSPFSFDGD